MKTEPESLLFDLRFALVPLGRERAEAILDALNGTIAAGDALLEELQQHGLANHAEGECVAGAAMSWWRRRSGQLRVPS